MFLFRDDFRRCTDSEAYPLNLMLFTGLPGMGWEAYWYSSAQEIADPDKALSRWLKDGVLPGSSPPGEPGPTGANFDIGDVVRAGPKAPSTR